MARGVAARGWRAQVRCRGGNTKFRALRLETGNYSWGTEGKSYAHAVCPQRLCVPSERCLCSH